MWVLEASGDILRGRRMWLRPGKQYLFGRVKKEGVYFAIDHKTVSRKHFIIKVADVGPNEVAQIYNRTKITIIDQESKSGTQVNGEPLKGTGFRARELKQASNSVRPGTLDQELRIVWVPCVITLNLLKKDIKAGALKAKQERLRQLGVKVVADFVPDATTHVVSTKRNTIKGLQALICGKWLVAESLIDALEVQATPSTLSQEENPSQLELDFDSAWPHEKDHLPAPGKEPTLRSADTYAPGPDRTLIFEHFVFVLLEQTQYDSLLPVITTGHGKALAFKYTDGQTTVDEALDFLGKASGQKSFGAPGLNSVGGVVMVRWNKTSGAFSDAEKRFLEQVALKTDQRVIEQSEFLDAILANDASLLRQQVPLESLTEGLTAPPPSVAASFAPLQTQARAADGTGALSHTQTQRTIGHRSQTQQTQRRSQASVGAEDPSQNVQSSLPEGTSPQPEQNGTSQAAPSEDGGVERVSKKPRYRPPTQVKFDDDFDPDDAVPFDDVDDDVIEGLSQVEDSQPEATPAAPTQQPPPSTRKRRRSPSPASDAVAGMDELLSATNAMKKQRRDFQDDLRREGQSAQKPATIVSASKPQKKELDVREAMKRQHERQKLRLTADDSEEEHIPPPDPENREPADLAVVEVLDIPIRRRLAQNRGQNPEDDPRWDSRWNGLKNFKKFRPQEKGAARRTDHSSKIIVPLVPTIKRKNGLGEEYWEKSTEERERERREKRKKEKRRAQESLSQRRSDDFFDRSDDSDEDSFRPSRRRAQLRPTQIELDDSEEEGETTRTSPTATRLQEEAAAIVDHDIDVDSPRRTRGDDARTQSQMITQRSSGPSSSSRAATQKSRGSKRPASSTASTAASKKRQKTLPVQEENSGDDSDDMKFRLGKGKGRK